MKDEPRIEDISKLNVNDEYLVRNENSYCSLHRYSREQVLKIVELVYMPHQVEQYNKKVRKEDEVRCPDLSEDEKEVTLEQILPGALESIGKLYDAYSAIPKGSYYYDSDMTIFKDIKFEDTVGRLSPTTRVSKKRFNGFVTSSLDFWYSPFGVSRIEVPDRYIYVPWELNDRKCYIHFDTKSNFSTDYQVFDEKSIAQVLRTDFRLWKEAYFRLVPDKWNHEFKDKFGTPYQRHWGVRCKSWEEYMQRCIRRDKLPVFNLFTSRHECRKLGFVPKTNEIKSAKQLVDFVIRFLSFKEKGKKFIEWRF